MRTVLAISFVIATTLPLLAQSAPPANPNANTPAVTTPNSLPTATPPVAGANSFTEGQAKSRIEGKGFSNVTGLAKDDSGVWRGKAMQGGKSVSVSVDFQGNVVGK